MTGELLRDSVDFNETAVLEGVLRAAILQLKAPTNWHDLEVHLGSYFRTTGSDPPSAPGWYVIIDLAGRPLYVGESEDLCSRLNSSNGSLDGFHNSKRKSEPARNFLKRFVSEGLVDGLRVGIVEEAAVLHELRIPGPLSKLDRCNVEKVLDIFRAGIVPEKT